MNGYNFTDRVRKVLQMAREEAARLQHEYVGTEHILLGLLHEGEGVAAAALTNLNVDFEAVQALIDAGITLEMARAEVLRLLGGDQLAREHYEDPDAVDQRFKTAIALAELHHLRFGSYPDSLDDLEFLGAQDRHTLLKGLRYEKLPDGYALDIVTPKGEKPRLRYPPDFWKGLGIRRTNVDRSGT